jgi:hypothetical protein
VTIHVAGEADGLCACMCSGGLARLLYANTYHALIAMNFELVAAI